MPHSGRTNLRSTFSGTDLLFLLLCVIVLVAGVITANDLCIYTPDSTRYLVWAKSLAMFDGYKDTTFPDPLRYVVHAPLYPLLLAPVALFFPYQVVAAKLLTLCCGIIVLILFYRWISYRTEKRTALIISCLLAVNPLFFLYSTEVLSDIPFAVSLILFFLMMERIVASREVSLSRTMLLAVVITAGILLREIGFSMLASAALFFLLRKRWKETLIVVTIPMIVYGLWYVRNEVVIASFELPPLTNAKLFTHHFFSSPDDRLLQELASRAWNNIAVYGKGIGKLLFFPFYGWFQYDVVFLTKSPLVQTYGVLEVLQYPLMLFTMAISLYGAYVDIRTSSGGIFRIIFFSFYLLIVLLYPVNDIRFVIPMMILMLYYCSIVLRNRWKMMPVFILLLAIPNLIWDQQFIGNSHSYNQSPISFYQTTVGLKKYPSHFTKPFRLVGEWMNDHADSSSVILSQWKDLACWVNGRKVFPTDQTISLDEFEHTIRDYGITHLVTVVQKSGAREFEFQMHQSARYEFEPLQRIANVEVFRIRLKILPRTSSDTATALAKGITLLDEKRYSEAEQLFDDARKADSLNMPLLFYSSVAKEFSMKLGEASEQFSSIGSLPQSLMYLEEAAVHQQMIATLKALQQHPSQKINAEQFYRLGGQCWALGYRTQALSYIKTSIDLDSAFLPALFLGIHTSLLQGDTLTAKNYLLLAKKTTTDHPAVRTFEQLFLTIDSLRMAHDRLARSRYYLTISKMYRDLGIVETAIDNAQIAVKEDRNNAEAVSMLADIYRAKRRFAPALRALHQAVMLDPQNISLQEQLRDVEQHTK